jgi:tRNA(Arg) A34 adenosine deaminase TadA
MPTDTALLRQAVQLAHDNRAQGGRPFGAVLARGGEVIATGVNEIVHSHDPSAHAEMQALRAATRELARPSLAGCAITPAPCAWPRW